MEVENVIDYIYDKSTFSFVEKIDENIFKKGFISYFNNPYIIDFIKDALASGKQIGAPSGFGQAIITSDSPPAVIKLINICGDYSIASDFKKSLCDMAKDGDLIYYIPNTTYNKTIVLAPNHIAELLMALILSSEKVRKYSPNFVVTHGVQYINDKISPHYFQVMEPLVPFYESINSQIDITWYAFQIMWALSKAQELLRYTHFDLHGDNIMARNLSGNNNVLSIYELDDNSYVFYRSNFDTVIIDYGFNRLETSKSIIIGRSLYKAGKDKRRDWFEFYNFNPYVDMFTAIYSVLFVVPDKLLKESSTAMTADKANALRTTGISLMRDFFKLNNNDDPFAYITTNNFMLNYWRPKPEVFYTLQSLPLTPTEFLKLYAANNIPFSNLKSDDDIAIASKDTIIKIRSKNIDFKRRFKGKDGITSVKFYPKLPNDQKMDITQYPIRSLSDLTTTHYMAKNSIKIQTFNMDNIIFHVSMIDQNRLLSNGYKWEFDCCRTVIQDILRNPLIKEGIVINSSFFRIKDNFEPIGHFKTRDLTLNNPIPDEYKDYYGLIFVDGTTNVLSILSGGELKHVKKQAKSQYVSSGSIIVYNGLKVDSTYCDIIDQHDVKIFNCRQPLFGGEPDMDVFADGLPNCSKIKPGELKHACQKNPRSALFVTADNKVGFVYVEGRNERSAGATFQELSNICMAMGAERAINLDGGASSQLLWRDKNNPVINQLNPDHNYVYPVGATIGFIKR